MESNLYETIASFVVSLEDKQSAELLEMLEKTYQESHIEGQVDNGLFFLNIYKHLKQENPLHSNTIPLFLYISELEESILELTPTY